MLDLPLKVKNIIGTTIGHWLVLSYLGRRNHNHCILCRCQCGVEKSVRITHLLCEKSKSCGCYHRPLQERFWEKVDKPAGPAACWLWTGYKDSKGYGRITIDKKPFLAHRFSYKLHKGPIPKGLFVCHHCDVPACVNPEHLFVGTQFDNMQDMTAKGRRVGNIKLTSDQVCEIRERVANGETQISLAKEFGIDRSTISKVVNRKRWQHVH